MELDNPVRFIGPTFTIKCVLQSPELMNWEFVKSLFPATFSSLGVLNEDPMVWLDGTRPPLLDLLVPVFTLKCVWQSHDLVNWELVESLFTASFSSMGGSQ
jgi:hypothetical protein